MRGSIFITATVAAALIAFGRLPFGLHGANAVIYALALALPYYLLHIILFWRIGITARTGFKTTRPVWLFGWLSALNAVAFAVTVPDIPKDCDLAAIVAPCGADPLALEMSIALCNPFAILSFLFIGLAVGVAVFNSRPTINPDIDA